MELIINQYIDKCKRYCEFNLVILKDPKKGSKISQLELRRLEGKLILDQLQRGDSVYLLDDKGKEYSSKEFAEIFLQKQMNAATRHLVFIIGGAFGFDKSVIEQSKGKISLSKMTFTHQMVRIIFLEQLYRGYSILKGEKYHHE
jgi:23S rRNA (pseudouridine1915-N3)-methyltransferase